MMYDPVRRNAKYVFDIPDPKRCCRYRDVAQLQGFACEAAIKEPPARPH
jgi:hypothetical protein